jgi:hypothetical protein
MKTEIKSRIKFMTINIIVGYIVSLPICLLTGLSHKLFDPTILIGCFLGALIYQVVDVVAQNLNAE